MKQAGECRNGMTLQIQFVTQPKFALGAQADSTTAAGGGNFSFASDDAADIRITQVATNKAANSTSKNSSPSVLSQFVTQLQSIVSQIQSTDKQLSQTAQGTAQYDALTKQQDSLDGEYDQAVQLQGSDGQSTALGNVVQYLNTLSQAQAQGASSSQLQSLYSEGTNLVGSQGLAALQNGTISAQQLVNGLQSLTGSDANSINQTSTAEAAGNILTTFAQALGQGNVQQSSAAPAPYQVSRASPAAPIKVNELDLGGAQNLALSIRSASPDDLIRAAVSGVNQLSVDALILKPEDYNNTNKQNSYEVQPLQSLTSDSSSAN